MDTKVYQFYHYNPTPAYVAKYSAVCIVPPKEEFLNQVYNVLQHKEQTIKLQLGYTVKHEKDNFSKKIGREMALKNLKEYDFNLNNISFIDNFVYIDLITQINNRTVNIKMEIKKERKSVYFVDCGPAFNSHI